MQRSRIKPRQYRIVPNDPLEVKAHVLRNGLRLFMSVNRHEPRIFTNIAFRAGSKMDPPDTTGLAHYMEHMLFKGGSRIGALDWEREKPYLERIAALYEEYRKTEDEEERRRLYAGIDRLSFEAAGLAAPNEYDKLAASLGANGTNAYTWLEQTVYVNDIPANELERWMELEAERFRSLALRLFHTELETVYEEFNIGQDQDSRRVNAELRAVLFPRHPYGTQTTIGSAGHLRNPSMVNILRFFETYYVPNNMAVVMAGDFDPDEAVYLAEQYFGQLRPGRVPPLTFEEQPPVEGPVRREISGREAPFVQLAWRLEGAQSDAPLMATLLQHLLYNDQAGLLDIGLNQRQRVLESEAWSWNYEDYSAFGLYGKAREGQSPEEVEQLLLGELDKVRRGQFGDWLLEEVVNDLKLVNLRTSESNRSRVGAMTNMFILGVDWARFVNRIDWMAAVTKADLAAWVTKRLRHDNYAVVYKQQGENPNSLHVDKPPITPVRLERDALSDYAKTYLAKTPPNLIPQFADFESGIRTAPLAKGLQLHYVNNADNGLFRLDFIFEAGRTSDRLLAVALLYLPYLGTRQHTSTEIQQAFFRLGLTFDVYLDENYCYITLQGLDENLEKGIEHFEGLLADVQPDERALKNVIADILTRREHSRHDRGFVLRKAMSSYARYGAHSPFRYRLSQEELAALDPGDLTRRIRELTAYEHQVYYYGPRSMENVAQLIDRLHPRPDHLLPPPEAESFIQLDTDRNRLLVLDFPIVQTDVMLISKGTPCFNLEEYIMRELYNDYFGYGLSSVVFQEIRESRALAYTAYALYGAPRRKEEAHYLQAYLGTQPDKLSIAVPALLDIIENMPVVSGQIEQARSGILRRIETERIPPRNIFWAARSYRELGFHRDLRQDIYHHLQKDGSQSLIDFHREYVKGRHFTFLLLGDKKRMDKGFLSSFGEVEELTMDEVFGF